MYVALVTKHCKRLVTQKKEGKKNGFSVLETLKTRAFLSYVVVITWQGWKIENCVYQPLEPVCRIETRDAVLY